MNNQNLIAVQMSPSFIAAHPYCVVGPIPRFGTQERLMEYLDRYGNWPGGIVLYGRFKTLEVAAHTLIYNPRLARQIEVEVVDERTGTRWGRSECRVVLRTKGME